MQLIPAVDLLGEDATRLEQGDYDRELFRRPALAYLEEVAATSPEWIHVVDLDGARSGVMRPELLAQCVRAAGSAKVQLSGGIRTTDAVRRALELGAQRVLIGTAAFRDDDALASFVREFGDQLAVSLDSRDGTIRVAGWLSATPLTVSEAATRCADAGVARVLATAIDRDGTMRGPDLDLYRLLAPFPFAVIAAGGVRNKADLADLSDIGCEAAVAGRAFAEGAFDAT